MHICKLSIRMLQYTWVGMIRYCIVLQVEADGLEFEALEHTISLESPNIPDVFPSK